MDSFGTTVFNTLKWDVAPSKYYMAYAALAVWLLAVVFLILAWINAGDETKQKNTNVYLSIVALGLILGMYFTIAVCA
jgi:uncharacterized membrane protein